jgi:hypothetical protein
MVTWISRTMFNSGEKEDVHQYVAMGDPNHA